MGDKSRGALQDILDRRNQSREYMQQNYWDEFEDVYRAYKCRTKPIMYTDKRGNRVEDKNRTNVCMPEISLIARRKTARLTANPPEINYTTPNGPGDPVADKLTALTFMQFDRSGEGVEHERVLQSVNLFGFGVSKIFWNTIEVSRPVRLDIRTMTRQQYADAGGEQDPDALESGVNFGDDEIKQLLLANAGNEFRGSQSLVRYEGPIVKSLFVGDVFLEPGCRTLNESAWVVENYQETDLWLEKQVKETYTDPETGKELPVISLKKAQQLVDKASPSIAIDQQQPYDLRRRLRVSADNKTTPQFPTRLIPGKRFDILECHTRDEYGQYWIEYVGNEAIYLGKKPYPFELMGRYCYTACSTLPDLLNAYGDSTPRLLRWQHFLHNAVVGSRKDLVNNILRPLILQQAGEDVPDEVIQRALYRVIQVRNLGSFKPFEEPPSVGAAISAGLEEETQILKMISMAEPNVGSTDQGSDVNPQAGKTATTAILAAKSADSLTQYEMNNVSAYLKELGEKKLLLNQQLGDQWNIPRKYAQNRALTELFGKAASVDLSAMEIQGDIQVEPAAMSMLSVDDDLRRNGSQQLLMMAMQDPATFNLNYAAEMYASTIRGVDPSKAVNPPTPPPPPAPKVNVSIAVKYDELPSEVQAELLQAGGIQVTPELATEMQLRDTLKGVQQVSDAADAASNIDSPPDHVLDAQREAVRQTSKMSQIAKEVQ